MPGRGGRKGKERPGGVLLGWRVLQSLLGRSLGLFQDSDKLCVPCTLGTHADLPSAWWNSPELERGGPVPHSYLLTLSSRTVAFSVAFQLISTTRAGMLSSKLLRFTWNFCNTIINVPPLFIYLFFNSIELSPWTTGSQSFTDMWKPDAIGRKILPSPNHWNLGLLLQLTKQTLRMRLSILDEIILDYLIQDNLNAILEGKCSYKGKRGSSVFQRRKGDDLSRARDDFAGWCH